MRQVSCLDTGRPRADPRLVERGEEGRTQLAWRVGRSSEVVRPVRDRPDVVGTDIRDVEVGADEDGSAVPDAEECRQGDERIRDGPILDGCLEAAE
jgi:hypothetical protein